jgi:hypothetical protein
MKKITSKLLLIVLATIASMGFSQVSFALTPFQVCTYTNNQYRSVDQKVPVEDREFSDKMVVITEERLGAPDGKTTFNCYRETKCTVKPTEVGTEKDGKTPKTQLLRQCVTTITTDSPANCTTNAKIAEQVAKAPVENEFYTICEPIMVYVSQAGTELLYYYMGQIYKYMATLGGLIAVLALIVAGIMRSTAGDNTTQITEANKIITKCISGLVVLFLSAIILYTINPNFFVIK